MADTLELLRDLEKDARYISTHDTDSFIQQKAHGMCRAIKKLKAELAPPPSGDGYS